MDQTNCRVVDSSWGPWARQCRGGLDFTLLFEEAIFSILPTALLLIAASLRVAWLLRARNRVAEKGFLLILKQSTIVILALLKLGVVLLWVFAGPPRTVLSLVAAALNFLALFPLSLLSYTEHVFSVSPSVIAELYLLLTMGLDAVRIRTLWLYAGRPFALAGLETATLAVKLALIVAEARSKTDLLRDKHKAYTGEQLSGLYGRSLFTWLASTLWNGFHRFLNAADLFGPQDDESAENQRERFRQLWAQRQDKTTGNALLSTLFAAMPGSFLVPAIPRLIIVALTLAQPLLLKRMLEFVQDDGYDNRAQIGHALIGAFAFLYGLTAVFKAWFAHSSNRLSLELRSALIDATYRKLLRLRLTALDTGKATTLINVDVQHIMDGSIMLHDVWASFVTVAIAVYLLFLQIQLAFIAPLLCTLLITVAGGMFSGALGERQVAWLASTEARVKSTMSMISSFKEVKMLGLSGDYLTSLQKLRLNEVNLGRRFRRIISIIVTLSGASTELSILVAYGGFAIICKIKGLPLTVGTLFSSLALLRISLDPLFLLIQGTPTLVSFFKCLGRIQELLNDDRQIEQYSAKSLESSTSSLTRSDEAGRSGSRSSGSTRRSSSRSSGRVGGPIPPPLLAARSTRPVYSGLAPPRPFRPSQSLVDITNASFCWKEKDTPAVTVMELSIHRSSFTAVIGPVGSGKSTLLKAILGELEQVSGIRRLDPATKIAYCDQEPWLLDRSIRENIIGSLYFDAAWYRTVIEACALAQDIAQFPDGDETGVGSQGSALSGGQRARVALARAVYSQPDLILLDDIFSGLDRKSAQHVFSAVFSSSGLLAKQRCAVVLNTHATHFLSRFDSIIVLDSGIVTHHGEYEDLLAEGIINDSLPGGSESTAGDLDASSTGPLDAANPEKADKEVENPRLSSEWNVYGYFLKSCGVAGMCVFFALAAAIAAGRSFENVWLKMWAEDSSSSTLTYYICVFTALIVGGVILLYALCHFFFDVLLSSSSLNLYFGQLNTLMRAPISYVVSVGSTTIANRFIQDIMLIDDELPMALVNTTTSLFGSCAETVIVLISSQYISAAIPVLIGLLWIIQKFYLRTSKQLRLMDIEAKAPLSALMLETIKGIVAIRAFGRTGEFSACNTGHLDHSQRAMYMLLSVQVWLKMILDFVVCFLAILVVSIAVATRSSQSAGFLGLALVNLISLSNSFKYLITFWAQLEASIGAVARIKRFNADVKPEDAVELPSPHAAWPTHGEIEFQHVSATYDPSLPPAIYDVSLRIDPGSKVAVCGRSGSGKSSLLSTLLRCLDLASGSIIIDGQDITRVSRDALRKRIMTLPQKSLFINASIRDNMTLWAEHPTRPQEELDVEMEAALKKVGIWDALFARRNGVAPRDKKHDDPSSTTSSFDASSDSGEKTTEAEVVTLDSDLDPDSSLSIGQQQLFCLARGLFQHGDARIVLMDEFTSSMDNDTEMLVRRIVKDDLGDKTVVEVIHRLQHILDFDVAIVVDKGRVVETGHPVELLQKEGGVLRELYLTTRG